MVKVVVRNLPPSTTIQTLKDIFKGYPDVRDCNLENNVGYVTFGSEESGIHAVNNLNGFEFRGFEISIDFANQRVQRPNRPSGQRNFRPPMNPYQYPPQPSSAYSGYGAGMYGGYGMNPNPYNIPKMSNNNGYESGYAGYGGNYGNGYEDNVDYSENYQDYGWDSNNMYGGYGSAPGPSGYRSKPDYGGGMDSFGNQYPRFGGYGESGAYPMESPMKPLQPQWYEDSGLMRRGRGRRPFRGRGGFEIKSYIDEYDDETDYSKVDPYPSYLKQYQR